MRPLIIHRKGEVFLGEGGVTLENLPQEFQKSFPELSPKYLDRVSLMAGVAARRALGEGGEGPKQNFAVIVGTAFGAIDPTIEFDHQALLKGPNAVNPMDFPNTVANAAGSRIGIWLQLKGPNVTLTNSSTSFIDALGMAWEGLNGGLFEACLAGAVDKVPDFLKPYGPSSASERQYREGSAFLFASDRKKAGFLFQVVDYLALQLKPDGGIPAGFLGRWEDFWKGVDWLGFPAGTPLEPLFPKSLERPAFKPSLLEMGLSGWAGLETFLSSPSKIGVLGAFSQPEKKFALIKIDRKEI